MERGNKKGIEPVLRDEEKRKELTTENPTSQQGSGDTRMGKGSMKVMASVTSSGQHLFVVHLLGRKLWISAGKK